MFDYGWKEYRLILLLIEDIFADDNGLFDFEKYGQALRTYRPRKIIKDEVERYCHFERNPKTLQLRKSHLELLALLIIKDFSKHYETSK